MTKLYVVCDKVVCERWCEEAEEEEDEEDEEADTSMGCRSKNKSPTQFCGEQLAGERNFFNPTR